MIDFTLDSYSSFIEEFKSQIIQLKDIRVKDKGLIIRHDVDASVEKAFEMSQIELRFNTKTTYHFLLTSPLYNIFSPRNSSLINQMIQEGIEIGLHFDTMAYLGLDNKGLKSKLLQEKRILEKHFKITVESFSLHNPSLEEISFNANQIDTFLNASSSIYYQANDDNYISDSAFSYKGKNPFDFCKKANVELIQLLVHPLQYYTEGETKLKRIFLVLNEDFMKSIDEVFKYNRLYNKEFKN